MANKSGQSDRDVAFQKWYESLPENVTNKNSFDALFQAFEAGWHARKMYVYNQIHGEHNG